MRHFQARTGHRVRRRRQLCQGVPGGVQAATGHALRTVSRQLERPHLFRSTGYPLEF